MSQNLLSLMFMLISRVSQYTHPSFSMAFECTRKAVIHILEGLREVRSVMGCDRQVHGHCQEALEGSGRAGPAVPDSHQSSQVHRKHCVKHCNWSSWLSFQPCVISVLGSYSVNYPPQSLTPPLATLCDFSMHGFVVLTVFFLCWWIFTNRCQSQT